MQLLVLLALPGHELTRKLKVENHAVLFEQTWQLISEFISLYSDSDLVTIYQLFIWGKSR